jgi:predicted transcriptional regulator
MDQEKMVETKTGRISRTVKKRLTLTPLELQIMQVLWEHGPGNVQAVLDKMTSEPKLAYTTVQTMLTVLHRKGKVKRTMQGRSYEYRAAVTEDKAMGTAVSDLVERVFGGSVEGLLMSLVKSQQVDAETLARVSERLAQESEADDNA